MPANAEVLAQAHQHEAHEAVAHVEQQAETTQHHPHLETAHGVEGHVCTPDCEHSQMQANEMSDDLFADLEKDHVCGPNCEHHQSKADEMSDSLFNDLSKPEAETTKPKVEPAKIAADKETANRAAKELDDHQHEAHKPHVCDAHCEHNQPQADKHADSLFDNLEKAPHQEQKTAAETIAEQIVDATEAQQRLAVEVEIAKQATIVKPEMDAALRQRIDATEASQAVVESNTKSMPEKEKQNIAERTEQVNREEAKVPAVNKPVERSKTDAIEAVEPIQKSTIETNQAEITDGDGEEKTEGSVEFNTLSVSEDMEPVDIEQADSNDVDNIDLLTQEVLTTSETMVEESSEVEDLTFEAGELPIALSENDEISLWDIAVDAGATNNLTISEVEEPAQELFTVPDRTSSTEQNVIPERELKPAQQAVVAELISAVEPEDAPEVQEIIEDIFELIKGVGTTESHELAVLSPTLKEKLEELAAKLSLTYEDLAQMLEFSDDQELIFDQEAYDILHGLRKDLSIEYSFEFSQFSSTQSTNKTMSMAQVLGEIILLVLTRNRQPLALAA